MRITAVALGMAFGTTLLLAQNLAELVTKAPPDIEEALRARVNKFYQLQMEGKYRAADEFVAEDSKDVYFGADKPRCRSFTLGGISYTDNFTRATVMAICDTEMMMPPVGMIPVKMPLQSRWKVINGEWYWYVEPAPRTSPLGGLFGAPGSAPSPPPAAPASGPAPLPGAPPGSPMMFPMAPVDVATVQNAVRADRKQVSFSAGKTAEERVVLTNSLPGAVELSLMPPKLPGFELALDKRTLTQSQSAMLTIHYQPSAEGKPESATVKVLVSPVNQEIPIQIQVQ